MGWPAQAKNSLPCGPSDGQADRSSRVRPLSAMYRSADSSVRTSVARCASEGNKMAM